MALWMFRMTISHIKEKRISSDLGETHCVNGYRLTPPFTNPRVHFSNLEREKLKNGFLSRFHPSRLANCICLQKIARFQLHPRVNCPTEMRNGVQNGYKILQPNIVRKKEEWRRTISYHRWISKFVWKRTTPRLEFKQKELKKKTHGRIQVSRWKNLWLEIPDDGNQPRARTLPFCLMTFEANSPSMATPGESQPRNSSRSSALMRYLRIWRRVLVAREKTAHVAMNTHHSASHWSNERLQLKRELMIIPGWGKETTPNCNSNRWECRDRTVSSQTQITFFDFHRHQKEKRKKKKKSSLKHKTRVRARSKASSSSHKHTVHHCKNTKKWKLCTRDHIRGSDSLHDLLAHSVS